MPIQENIKKLNAEIPKDVLIVAATKARSIEEITEAIDAGIKIIGENYIQEAEEKYKSLKGKVKFHYIGHLQANKVKKAVQIFDMIETVDSKKLAKEIDKRCREINKIMPVLIEINIGKEPNKDGAMPNDVFDLIKDINNLKNIKIMGLMAMAPQLKSEESYRPYFIEMKILFEKIKKEKIPDVEMKYLSMGMSGSYKTAVEEGSNIVRIGTALFGERKS